MEKPTTLQSAIDALEQADSTIAKLEGELTAANALIDSAATAQAKVNELARMNSELEEKISALENTNKTLAEQASLNELKLNEAIAAAGVPPVAVKQQEMQEKSQEQLWAEYRALSVYDRPAFWAKNKHILTK
jgi:DNA repair exonuclease SbcCD ATPase subunit